MSDEWWSEQGSEQTDDQTVWDEVNEWVEDVTDSTPDGEPPPSSAVSGLTDIAEQLIYPVKRDAEAQAQSRAHQSSVFRGSLSSAIQATEVLGPESSSDQVRYAAALTSSAANTAYAAADAVGHDTSTGSRYDSFYSTLAWAASQLESVAHSDSADVRQQSIPGIVSTMYGVAGDADSL